MNPKVKDELKPIGSILAAVAKEFGLEVADLQSRSTGAEVIEARQVAMYIGWHSYTLTGIGRTLGRTPATVSHGYGVIMERLRTSERLRGKVERVNALLKEGG